MQKNNDSGFSLVEVLIAFAILASSLVILLSGFSVGFRGLRVSDTRITAMRLAQSKLNEMMVVPLREFGAFDNKFSWRARSTPYSPSSSLKYKATPNLHRLTVKVTWTDGVGGKGNSVELSTLALKSRR